MKTKKNKIRKNINKKSIKKKIKKQYGGNNVKNNKFILNYIKNIEDHNIHRCKEYESISNDKKKYINLCNKTSKELEGHKLPLCYIHQQKNQNGEDIYQCNSITEGNDFQKIKNFYNGFQQSEYVKDMNKKEEINFLKKQIDEKNSRSYFNIIFDFMNKYNPIVLKNQIDVLKQKIDILENNKI